MAEKKIETKIGEILKRAKKNNASYFWLCQVIAFAFKEKDPRFNSYRFSKACGYNFDVMAGHTVSKKKLKKLV